MDIRSTIRLESDAGTDVLNPHRHQASNPFEILPIVCLRPSSMTASKRMQDARKVSDFTTAITVTVYFSKCQGLFV